MSIPEALAIIKSLSKISFLISLATSLALGSVASLTPFNWSDICTLIFIGIVLWNGSLKALRTLSLINSLRLKNIPIAEASLNCIFLNALTNWPAIGTVLANSANLVVERDTSLLK